MFVDSPVRLWVVAVPLALQAVSAGTLRFTDQLEL